MFFIIRKIIQFKKSKQFISISKLQDPIQKEIDWDQNIDVLDPRELQILEQCWYVPRILFHILSFQNLSYQTTCAVGTYKSMTILVDVPD